MFQELFPLVTERPIHLLLSAGKDGKLRVYVEPKAKDDDESSVCVSPFSVCDTPEALDANLGAALTDWIAARSSVLKDIESGLAASKANLTAAAEADKKEETKTASTAKPTAKAASDKPKGKPGPKPKVKASLAAPTPSLLDSQTAGAGNPAGENGGDAQQQSEPGSTLTDNATAGAEVQPVQPTESVAPVSAAPTATENGDGAAQTTLAPAAVTLTTTSAPLDLFSQE